MPKRIQRKRTKGWRMPDGAVYVGRPTRWGNPYWHIAKWHGVEKSLEAFRMTAQGLWLPSVMNQFPISYYDEHLEWLEGIGGHPLEMVRAELRGKDLACFCPLDKPCHADILLELANKEPTL